MVWPDSKLIRIVKMPFVEQILFVVPTTGMHHVQLQQQQNLPLATVFNQFVMRRRELATLAFRSFLNAKQQFVIWILFVVTTPGMHHVPVQHWKNRLATHVSL
jgi:hypothetical protein